eukprot:CAMPEP_0114523132 /NCGR_PEP_ID=MMETSP0109-20121206/21123_1 /TAXON_ID=29199 /ORGANISM="Chlorarachnion reptans, Strain CCCM449" /LENGTH=320 /DNA_ID=CAMNT_0001704417 /DNA_START=148 /DNA_END=1107 /DNA_ORIENTATION=+
MISSSLETTTFGLFGLARLSPGPAAFFAVFALVATAALLLLGMRRRLQEALKHLQVYQVARAQFLRPYTVACGVVWPRYTNQLGNNLFQYAYARLRARYLGLRFAAGMLNQDVFHEDLAKILDSGGKMGLGENANPFSKASPFEFLESEADYSGGVGKDSDPAQCDESRRQFLQQTPNAFAQDISYYERDSELIRGWMCPSVESHEKSAAKAESLGVDREDTIVFHLRFAGKVEGIFADPTYHELPRSYYEDVLRKHGHCRRAILVHDPKSREAAAEISARLKKEWPDLQILQQCASRCDDFMVMYRAKNLALSVSTFAW